MIDFRQICLFSILIINQNSFTFDSSDRKDLGRDVTDEILTWPALDTELIELDAMAAEQLKNKQSILKRERKRVRFGKTQILNDSLGFENSKRLRQELCNSGWCKVCSKKMSLRNWTVLGHYGFEQLVLGDKSYVDDHLKTLIKIYEKPEHAEIMAYFSEKIIRKWLM